VLESRLVPSTFTVNTFADTTAVNLITGQDSSGNISLRSALMAANNLGGSNTIDLPAGTYNLTIPPSGLSGDAASGDLDVMNDLTLVGTGIYLINASVVAQNGDRGFHIYAPYVVNFTSIAVSGGQASQGAGIYNAGTLTLSYGDITSNQASGAVGTQGGDGEGGGIYNAASGVLTLTSSTQVWGNNALGGNGAAGTDGAASTSSGVPGGNGTDGGNGGRGLGGGIYNDGGEVTLLSGSQVVGNHATGGSGGNGGAGGQGFTGQVPTNAPVSNGGNAGNGGSGGVGEGGGIFNNGGFVRIGDVSQGFPEVSQNFATGGAAGNGGNGGNGGSPNFVVYVTSDGGNGGNGGYAGAAGAGAGGSLYNAGGGVAFSNTRLINSVARGGFGGNGGEAGSGGAGEIDGNGGNAGAAGAASAGGDGLGGGIFNAGDSVGVSNTTISSNSVLGGGGGNGGNGAAAGGDGLYNGNGGSAHAGTDGAAAGRSEGGAVYNAAGPVVLSGCIFSNNGAGEPGVQGGNGGQGGHGGSATSSGTPGSGGSGGNGGNGTLGAGGAILCAGGTVTVDRTTLSANTANGSWGGFGNSVLGSGFSTASPPVFLPAGNGGAGGDARGGAIEILGGTFTLTNSTLYDNVASGGRGGVTSAGPSGNFNFGQTVAGNGGQGGAGGPGGNADGGAIDLAGGTLQVVSTTFAAWQGGNQAIGGTGFNGGAGGVGAGYGGSYSVYGNGGNGGAGGAGGTGLGGAINVSGGTLTLSSSTIALNHAMAGTPGNGGAGGAAGSGTSTNGNPGTNGAAGTGLGGGVQVSAGAVVKLFNTLLAADTGSGDPVHNITSSDVAGLFTSQGHNLVGDGSDGSGFSAGLGDEVGTAASPINALLGTLGANGGPTWTMALLSGSPAINAPKQPHSPTVPPLDQRGVPRDAAPDIGAFEASTITSVPTLTAPALQSAWSGSSTSFGLGSFTDSGAESPWKVTVAWGDGSKTVFTTTATGTLAAKAHAYKAPGFYTLTETVANAQGAVTSQTFLIQVGTLVVTPSASSMTAGTSIGLTVTVLDAAGHAVAGYTGKFKFTSTDTKATFRDAVTGAVLPQGSYTFVVGDHGTHNFTVQLVKAGVEKINVKGTTSGVPVGSATVTVGAAAPAVVAVLAGSGQSAGINTAFAAALQVKVTDAFGNAVSGVSVTFKAPASGQSGTFAGSGASVTVLTNASGVAAAPVFTANGLTGSYTVKATVSGVIGEADFILTNI
jgi:hypothetical protein